MNFTLLFHASLVAHLKYWREWKEIGCVHKIYNF